MPPANFTYSPHSAAPRHVVREDTIEYGYIWHTAGSGKTRTSFKASTLLKDTLDIEKCRLVMDRNQRPAFN